VDVELVQLAPIDVRIIRALHENARSPMSKIAAQLGLPESTVRHRLNRLVERGMIEFAAMVNPLQLGYQIWAQIHIEVELSRIRSVAQLLARAPEVYFVGIATGGYDVLVGAVFKSNKELLDFITGPMSKVPGILRTSTSSILEVVKRSMTFPLPEDVRPGRRRGRRPPSAAPARAPLARLPGNGDRAPGEPLLPAPARRRRPPTRP
jgi:Lrp/AsnC family transcriptional regulator for asnA, asnC and gidA